MRRVAVVGAADEEGPVILSRVVGCPPDAVRCDMPVTVAWDPLPDGHQFPVWKPA